MIPQVREAVQQNVRFSAAIHEAGACANRGAVDSRLSITAPPSAGSPRSPGRNRHGVLLPQVAKDIRINGVPLDPSGTYELATNNYIAHGGSGFEVLERNTTQVDTGISIRDVVQAAIIQYGTLPQPGVAEEDGRIDPVY